MDPGPERKGVEMEIVNVEPVQRAYKTPGYRPDGFEVWRGASVIDGTPIGVVVTHLRAKPMNRKIGNMAQAWILPLDVEPIVAARTGEDRAVCGSCRFRPSAGGGCYVPIHSTAQRVWWAWRKFGSYQPAELPTLDKPLRIGAWGDPGAVPIEVWRAMRPRLPGGWTAYTHRWRELPAADWHWCMASVDSAAEQAEAHEAGWRTFRVRGAEEPLLVSERTCPSAIEAPTHDKVTCAQCRLCGSRASLDGRVIPRRDIVIIAHGHRTGLATNTIREAACAT